MNGKTATRNLAIALALGGSVALASLVFAAEEKAETRTVKGEIVDLMCYLDHGAQGEKHKGCARKCIESGGPVGLLSGNTLYLVVGDHAPMNAELGPKAGETLTLKGKVVQRHGMRMIENSQVVTE